MRDRPSGTDRCWARVVIGSHTRYSRILQSPPDDRCLNYRRVSILCSTHARMAARGGTIRLITPQGEALE